MKMPAFTTQGLLPLLLLATALIIAGCDTNNSTNNEPLSKKATPVLNLKYSVIATYPHRTDAFSQGLILEDNVLYESQGLYGRSSVAILDFESGEKIREAKLDQQRFGEGLAKINNELIQLTWKSGDVFRYDADTLELIATQKIEGEGWGLTNFRGQLVSSNGSSTLYFRNSESLEVEKQITVRFAGRPLGKLNELEEVGDFIVANVFQSDSIVFIEGASGTVAAKIDLSKITAREKALGKADVANGIAFNDKTNTLLVTGKLWQRIYELKLAPHKLKGLPL